MIRQNSTVRISTKQLNDIGITRTAYLTGLDCLDIPVAMAVSPNSPFGTITIAADSTKQSALQTAIHKSLMLWHAQTLTPDSEVFGAYQDLVNQYPLVWPKVVPKGSSRDTLNQHNLSWVTVTQLNKQDPVYMPVNWFQQQEIMPSVDTIAMPGLVVAQTLESALCKGIFELIAVNNKMRFDLGFRSERWKMAILDLKTQPCWALLKKILAAQLNISLYNLQSELSIPCYQAVIEADASHPQGATPACSGIACHINSDLAITNAIYQAIEARTSYLSGSRDDIDIQWYETTIPKQPSSFPPVILPEPSFVQISDEEALLAHLQSHLASFGYEDIYYYRHPHAPLNVSVIHVVIPGMMQPHHDKDILTGVGNEIYR